MAAPDALAREVVDPAGDDARAAMSAYFAELDATFPGGFDPGDALGSGAVGFRSPGGSFIVLRDATGEVVACGGVQRIDERTGEVKRMWVAPSWRGRGVGWHMLSVLEGEATRLGYRRVVLDTNATLTAAIRMYLGAGYEPVDRYNDNPYAHHWFAKDLP